MLRAHLAQRAGLRPGEVLAVIRELQQDDSFVACRNSQWADGRIEIGVVDQHVTPRPQSNYM